ncbi:MAG: urease accessory protein UreD [Xanthobacteraceae bacterium]|nr:urease accessory protein UreD [Xanthobacteraceae bacterium]
MTADSSDVFAANRAMGEVAFELHNDNGVTRRGQLHEAGSLRVRFPSSDVEGLSAVFINTAGGIAGGDRFDIGIKLRKDTKLTVTTAAAEKIYRSHGPEAQLKIALDVEQGASLAWLPQETILFDKAAVTREIAIDLHEDASFLMCEMVVFGRTAMGETMRRGMFLDKWRVRRGGRLVFAENVRLDGDLDRAFAHRVVTDGQGAIGTVLIAPGDETLVEHIRDGVASFRGEVGVSCWNGFAMVRFCAQDAAQLRIDVMTVLGRVRPQKLPRLWLQ